MPRDFTIPYVVGQWVRGERFYGRESVIGEILEGPRSSLWLLGTRRLGKTSTLKQLEWLTASSPELGFVPVFWDFQGSEDAEELHLGFQDALLDAEERLAEHGIELAEVEAPDLFASLGRLRRRLRTAGRRLLLLCDEVEELIKLHGKDPSLLRKLRRSLQSGEEIRVVLTSTIRLWALAQERGDTSPFLHGFTPPVYLGMLTDEAARGLLRQSRLPEERRPQVSESVVEAIRERCDNHPYLLQLVGKRYVETGDLEEAVESVAADEMVSHFFSVDWAMLTAKEQGILQLLRERSAASSDTLGQAAALDTSQLTGSLLRLESLGLIRRNEDRQFILANHFFQRWLHRLTEPPVKSPPSRTEEVNFSQQITELLTGFDGGPGAPEPKPDELLPLVYNELRHLAGRYMSRERANHTLQPTALVHEAYLKLADQSRVSWKGRTHFFAVGAKVMRRLLIDHARGHRRIKRGGGQLRVTLMDELMPSPGRNLSPEQLLDLDRAIEKLFEIDPRQARIVELRYFGGLNVSEVAEVLGVSKRTVEADWAKARAWLEQEL